MKVRCEYCGKEYRISKCFYDRVKHHYCSRECSSMGRRKEKKTKCNNCGKEIFVKKYLLKKYNYCNKKCFDEWQSRNKIKLTCKTCGKEFYRSPSWLKSKQGFYCSMECRNKDESWKKKSTYKANYVQCHKKGLNKIELKGNSILDRLKIEYKTQYLINDKICVDVFIPKSNLIIQWDGNYWHGKNKKYEELEPRIKKRVDLDKSQDIYLKKCGYRVLRFWEDEIMNKEEYVYENIKKSI